MSDIPLLLIISVAVAMAAWLARRITKREVAQLTKKLETMTQTLRARIDELTTERS